MTDTLIICIGNVARGDDGVAHHVAELLAENPCTAATGVRIVTAVGLDVAMAADVAECTLLVVVDAERRAEPAVVVSSLEPGTAANTGHAIDAPGLLAVTSAVYGAAPRALLVSVAAPQMGHSDELSDVAKAASFEAASVVCGLLPKG